MLRALQRDDAPPLPVDQPAGNCMDFSAALALLRAGLRVRRRGWRATWLVIKHGRAFAVRGTRHIAIERADRELRTASTPWSPPADDLLAQDWVLYL